MIKAVGVAYSIASYILTHTRLQARKSSGNEWNHVNVSVAMHSSLIESERRRAKADAEPDDVRDVARRSPRQKRNRSSEYEHDRDLLPGGRETWVPAS